MKSIRFPLGLDTKGRPLQLVAHFFIFFLFNNSNDKRNNPEKGPYVNILTKKNTKKYICKCVSPVWYQRYENEKHKR